MNLEQLINFMLVFICLFRHKSRKELRLPISIWVFDLLLAFLFYFTFKLVIMNNLIIFSITGILVYWGLNLSIFIDFWFVLCQKLIEQQSFMMCFQLLKLLWTVRCSAICLYIQEVINLLIGLLHDFFLPYLLFSCLFFGTLFTLFSFSCTWCIKMW